MRRPTAATRLGLTPLLVALQVGAAFVLALAGCEPDDGIAGPESEPVGPPVSPEGIGIRLRVDLEQGTVTILEPEGPAAVRAPGMRPGGSSALALIGDNEIDVTATNFSRSAVGAFAPLKVRIRFDLALTNTLQHSDLVTPTFPAPPAGVQGVLLFPFRSVARGANGKPLPLAELRARPSVDWDGAPHNFFNSEICALPVLNDDCFRWESFGTPVAAGATTPARRVGFDVDPEVVSVDVYLLLAADIREGAVTGAIGGTIGSTLFGPIEGAVVTANPGGTTDASNASGDYLIANLAPGSRTLEVSGAPSSCFQPAPRTVTVVAGATADEDFQLRCRAIVYTAFLGSADQYEILRINADGTGKLRLTDDAVINHDPTWSPDGSRIAFISGGDLEVMNADGTGRVPLTDDTFQDLEPAWSPDGSRIAYVSSQGGSSSDIWVIGADGGNPTQLTTTTGSERNPSWSPDGTRLAFQMGGDIYVMAATPGASPTKLTTNPFGDAYPDWSPDGSRIAYVATSVAGDGEGGSDQFYEVFVMDADGSNRVRITDDDFFDLQPAWSPDGSTLVYTSYRPGTPTLVTVPAAGGTPIPLTPGELGEAADW